MIVKWIQSMMFGGSIAPSAAKPAKVSDNSVDLIHEAVKGDAAHLARLVEAGLPAFRRKERQERVRRSVKGIVNPEWQAAADDMVDEITDPIAQAVEIDPYYRRLFAAEDDR